MLFVNIGVDQLPKKTGDGRDMRHGFWGDEPEAGEEKVGNLYVHPGDPPIPLFAKISLKCPACNCEEILNLEGDGMRYGLPSEPVCICLCCNGVFGTITRQLFRRMFNDGELYEKTEGADVHYFDFIIKGEPARRIHGWAEFGGRIVQYG